MTIQNGLKPIADRRWAQWRELMEREGAAPIFFLGSKVSGLPGMQELTLVFPPELCLPLTKLLREVADRLEASLLPGAGPVLITPPEG